MHELVNIVSITESGVKTAKYPFSENIANRLSGCGQATMDCINDAYTNHGWVSVWAWVQTAFLPATAAAIAAACAAINCL